MRYLDHLTVLPFEFLSPTLSILFIVLAQKKNWRYIIIVHSYFGECNHPLFLEFHLHVQLLVLLILFLLTLMQVLHYQIQFKLYLYQPCTLHLLSILIPCLSPLPYSVQGNQIEMIIFNFLLGLLLTNIPTPQNLHKVSCLDDVLVQVQQAFLNTVCIVLLVRNIKIYLHETFLKVFT